jgi:hypothetical protein
MAEDKIGSQALKLREAQDRMPLRQYKRSRMTLRE